MHSNENNFDQEIYEFSVTSSFSTSIFGTISHQGSLVYEKWSATPCIKLYLPIPLDNKRGQKG
ncbi:MAG: hypothetical protein NZM38_06520 [Cytophagales bacterium]|nr:hypothetical protein [Cytophagales bacterium]MDW8384410.1 hypothetical protein [Flammeovirgaceae bacterium]